MARPICKECYDYKITKEFCESSDFFVYTATANNNALKYLPLMYHFFYCCKICKNYFYIFDSPQLIQEAINYNRLPVTFYFTVISRVRGSFLMINGGCIGGVRDPRIFTILDHYSLVNH